MRFFKHTFTNGAIFLALGSFTAKLLGAVYRVPLTNIIGGKGLGLYQMVFPLYCVLLDFSGAGFPSAISKIIASYGENSEIKSQKMLSHSLILSLILGVLGFVLMSVLAKPLAIAQGNENAYLGYLALAPAVLFVSLLSCYRGYFQGKLNMVPTAVSQVIEQAIKLCLGLLFAKLFMPNVVYAVGGVTLAVTISEIVAFIFLAIVYKIKSKRALKLIKFEKNQEIKFFDSVKLLIKTAIPITLISILIPMSQVADSFIIVNGLNRYRQDATILFGLLSGTAQTVINLPVAICYGVSTAVIPHISSKEDVFLQQKSSEKAKNITLYLAIPCVLICLFFSPMIVNILFSSLSQYQKDVTINLLRILSVNILLVSFLQTQNAILIGKGKTYMALIGLVAGVVVKIVLAVLLIPVQKLNIYGGAIALFACYFTACLVNFIIDNVKGRNYESQKSLYRQCANQE